ncbi:plasmid mobilization relaxosome protein MobC [Helicobacter fennelliae]|uniref:plasmid mobilization relaxosome protein MobC n=1 Tax=Helicobacter fennelliae TaxID=215 RepID=UPI00054F65DA|nr:plasmid mobilization relaxosome protein MobC [Helicobacter fennelliae]STP07537.1 Bacterial mobilisation protein (MobC) [Helicobacter fennelliae]STP07609.1 Bacterial mobilisation protein (MobC) [Helicobacter fennelliae]
MNKSNIVSFRITHDNKERLCKIQEKSGLDKSKILNFLIESFEPHKHLELLESSNDEVGKKKIVLYLSLDEYAKLKQSAQQNFRGSVARELKFHALNFIYKVKIPDMQEIQSLNETRAELHKIGSNINQIAKAYNTQLKPNIDDKLLAILNDLREKIDKLSLAITTLLSNKRRLA